MRLSKSFRFIFATLVLVAIIGFAAPGHAAQVGEILVCYACQNTGNAAVDAALANNPGVASDGILFAFVNTSSFAITGGVFSENASPLADSFMLPTIAAGSTFILIPGVTTDGGTHPSGALFSVSHVMDTSDGEGGLADDTEFTFTGLDNGLTVTSLTAGTSSGVPGSFAPFDPGLFKPFRDNPMNGSTSFIGQGPSSDGGCSNCYFGEVATLQVPNPTTGVPEPATLGLLFAGVGLLACFRRRLAQK